MFSSFILPARQPTRALPGSRRALFILLSLVVLLSIGWGQSGVTATFSGYVLHGESGEGLPGANVYFVGTDIGTASNIDGYFVLPSLEPGPYTVRVTYVGFEPVQAEIILKRGEGLKRDFELSRHPLELEGVEVTGERLARKVNIQASRVTLTTRQLQQVPQIGEADLLRTLQALPGVLTPTEFSTGLVIRGGNTDQNLILLDGITVYNPSHLGGLFSNFILDAVKQADLIKGGFNAEYGGRLSAVLNVRSREGNQNRFDGKASLSLLSAQTTLEGALGTGAWLVAARRTYFDQIFRGTDLYFPYYFYDVQGHVFQDFTERDRLSLSWYVGRDDLTLEDVNLTAGWGNQTFSTNYRKLFGPRLISHWMLAVSRFDTQFDLGGGSGVASVNSVTDKTFRSDWTYFVTRETQLRMGIELKDLTFIYENTWLDSALFKVAQSPLEGAIFAKAKRWLTPTLMVEPGVRLSYYENHPTKWYLNPRLGIKYLLTADRYVNLAAGVYRQFIETVQDDFNPTILDQWFAVDPSVEPASSLQYLMGYEEFFGKVYRVQAEIYYKTLANMLTFIENRAAADEEISDEALDDNFDLSDGYAYGFELFVQKEFGRLNGWVSYAYSVARKRLHRKEYFTNWDRRHAFNIVGNFRLNKKWDLSLRWTYQTGQPYTPILGYYFETLPWEAEPFYRSIPGGRNSVRYPPYHRLDLAAERHFRLWGVEVDLLLQVVNTYWRKNVFRYVYHFGDPHNGIDDDHDGRIDEPDEGIPQRVRVTVFPILPSIGVKVDF
ncbi:MAG: carboxypeptidase-like regulatory domain-containing protein [Fidelibacterota bacterium]